MSLFSSLRLTSPTHLFAKRAQQANKLNIPSSNLPPQYRTDLPDEALLRGLHLKTPNSHSGSLSYKKKTPFSIFRNFPFSKPPTPGQQPIEIKVAISRKIQTASNQSVPKHNFETELEQETTRKLYLSNAIRSIRIPSINSFSTTSSGSLPLSHIPDLRNTKDFRLPRFPWEHHTSLNVAHTEEASSAQDIERNRKQALDKLSGATDSPERMAGAQISLLPIIPGGKIRQIFSEAPRLRSLVFSRISWPSFGRESVSPINTRVVSTSPVKSEVDSIVSSRSSTLSGGNGQSSSRNSLRSSVTTIDDSSRLPSAKAFRNSIDTIAFGNS